MQKVKFGEGQAIERTRPCYKIPLFYATNELNLAFAPKETAPKVCFETCLTAKQIFPWIIQVHQKYIPSFKLKNDYIALLLN